MRERKCVVTLPVVASLSFQVILVVHDVAADAVPAQVLTFGFERAVSQYSHALIVETVWLEKVYNVETDRHAGLGVRNAKEIPLRVSIGVDVVLKD